jgi:rubrerythrin
MKKPASLIIMLGSAKPAGKPSREESLRKLNKMASEEAASRQEDEGEGGDWSCPDCGTVVMATMPKKSMKCPCCGAEMEMDEEAEDMEEGEEY